MFCCTAESSNHQYLLIGRILTSNISALKIKIWQKEWTTTKDPTYWSKHTVMICRAREPVKTSTFNISADKPRNQNLAKRANIWWVTPLVRRYWLLIGPYSFRIQPIRRLLDLTNQELVCLHQLGGSPLITSFCPILISKSVGWDILCQSSTNQESPWLDQSEGGMCWPMGAP